MQVLEPLVSVQSLIIVGHRRDLLKEVSDEIPDPRTFGGTTSGTPPGAGPGDVSRGPRWRGCKGGSEATPPTFCPRGRARPAAARAPCQPGARGHIEGAALPTSSRPCPRMEDGRP